MIPAVVGAAIIGGGASALGGYLSSSGARSGGAKQREFEEYMSNTAHQREVKDLMAAGLNPILSANRGASTPSVDAVNTRQGLGEGIASAGRIAGAERVRLQNETELATTQSELNEQNSAKAQTEATLNRQRLQTELALGAKLTEEANASVIHQALMASQELTTKEQSALYQAQREALGYDIKRKKFFGNLWDVGNIATDTAKKGMQDVSDMTGALTDDNKLRDLQHSGGLKMLDHLNDPAAIERFMVKMEENIKRDPRNPQVEGWRQLLSLAAQKKARLEDKR